MNKVIESYKIAGKWTVFGKCGHVTTLKYARKHGGLCRLCSEPNQNIASREEQHARYLDCGPAAWDDR